MTEMPCFDYYYAADGEQFSSINIPKTILTNMKFRGLSAEAKILYGAMLGHLGTSLQNGWITLNDEVYIIYTLYEMQSDVGFTSEKLLNLEKELENYGLIEKKDNRLGMYERIFVKNYLTDREKKDGRVQEET